MCRIRDNRPVGAGNQSQSDNDLWRDIVFLSLLLLYHHNIQSYRGKLLLNMKDDTGFERLL